MLNAATLAAIVAAVWAHADGVDYLAKIERLALCQTANPCCIQPGGSGKKRPDYLTAKKQDESIAIWQEDEMMIQLIVSAVTRRML